MITRKTALVWMALLALSGMFLLGQDTWPPTYPSSLQNASFESGGLNVPPDNWTAVFGYGERNFERRTDAAIDGVASAAHVAFSGAPGESYLYQTLSVPAGHTYRISGFYNVYSGGGHSVSDHIVGLGLNDGGMDWAGAQKAYFSKSNQNWTALSMQGVCNSGVLTVVLYSHMPNNVAPDYWGTYFDNMSVTDLGLADEEAAE